MNKIDYQIFELPLEKEYTGKYLKGNGIIIVNDINNTDALVHELTHHLWDKKNEQLLNYLNLYDLDFETKPTSHNKLVEFVCSEISIQDYYPMEDWVNEAVAYFMEGMPHDMLWKLNIRPYRDIIAGTFAYCNKDGNIIFKSDGDVLIENWSDFDVHMDFFKSINVIK